MAALAATSDGELISPTFWTAGGGSAGGHWRSTSPASDEGPTGAGEPLGSPRGLRARSARRRQHHLHELSHTLCTTGGLIAVDALNVKAMTAGARGTVEQSGSNVRQKAGLNRETLEQGWGELHRQLAYKTGVMTNLLTKARPSA